MLQVISPSSYIYFHIFKESALLPFFLCSHTLHVSRLCFVPVMFFFVFFGVFLLMRLSASSQHAECDHIKRRQ
jgi:hypothetical protein